MNKRWLLVTGLMLVLLSSAVAQQKAPRAVQNLHHTLDQVYFDAPAPPLDDQVFFVSNGPVPPVPPVPPGLPRIPMAWWKDSQLAQELNLTDVQKAKLEQTFTEHKLKLIDLRATLEKEEIRLQPLIESDRVDENQISAQLDKVVSARGQLEKATAMMSVEMRKVLTQEQWKKLQTLPVRMPMGGPEHGFAVRGAAPGRPPKSPLPPKATVPPDGPNGPDGKGRPTEEQPR